MNSNSPTLSPRKITHKVEDSNETKKVTFKTIVEDYLDLKDEIKELEARAEDYKTKIQRHLEAHQRDIIASPNFKVEKKTITSKRLLKEYCPPEIWDKYSTTTSHTSLYITRCVEGKSVRSSISSRSSRSKNVD